MFISSSRRKFISIFVYIHIGENLGSVEKHVFNLYEFHCCLSVHSKKWIFVCIYVQRDIIQCFTMNQNDIRVFHTRPYPFWHKVHSMMESPYGRELLWCLKTRSLVISRKDHENVGMCMNREPLHFYWFRHSMARDEQLWIGRHKRELTEVFY